MFYVKTPCFCFVYVLKRNVFTDNVGLSSVSDEKRQNEGFYG